MHLHLSLKDARCSAMPSGDYLEFADCLIFCTLLVEVPGGINHMKCSNDNSMDIYITGVNHVVDTVQCPFSTF